MTIFCHSLSFFDTRCTTRYHALSLVNIRCHWMYYSSAFFINLLSGITNKLLVVSHFAKHKPFFVHLEQFFTHMFTYFINKKIFHQSYKLTL